MSDANKAVFLSYASQDAEAAKRLCEALRAAGVEVWFDQSELVGGDQWDAKIRGQIGSCGLFVPLISANTQARLEGYFRLEWKLAAQRTHTMADEKTFLLPILIDGTRDAEAKVPAEFKTVQWTKLPAGETPPAFAARVKKLLNGSAVEAGRPRPADRGEGAAAPVSSRGLSKWWWVLPIFGVTMALLLVMKQGREAPVVSAPAVVAPVPVSEARKLANQAMQLLEDPNFTRETSWLADELCQRALALDAGDAEVWAVAAFASHNLCFSTYDTSADRREKARSQAARASQLDSQSVRAALAVARCLQQTGNDEEVLRMLRELHRRAPRDQQVILSLLASERWLGNEAAVQDLFRELRALPRTGLLPLALWYEELRLRTLGRFAEAEAILDEMLSGPEVLRGAYYEKLNLLMRSWHKLEETGAFIGKIPARFQQEPAFGSAIAYYWLWRAEPEQALQALALVPQDYFEEYAAREPKSFLTGWAHAIAGRPAAAQAEWRNALALVEARLKTDARNYYLLEQRPLLLALTGQREAAREAWQLRVELGGMQHRAGLQAEAQVFLALNEPEGAISAIERGWSSLKPGRQAQVLPDLRYHPAYAPTRADPRLQRILAGGEAMLRKLKEQPTGAPGPVDAAPASAPSALLPAPAQPTEADAKSVAVLAFANLSSDKEQEYFSDGISEELLNVLAKVPGLKVSARTSAFYFKGKDTPIPEIAQKLGVAYVIEGSVRKQGDKVRITAQLIKAADGFHVWSDTFTRDLKDSFAVQDEIAGLIAQNLRLTMGASAPGTKAAINPEAFDFYVQARQAWNRRTPEGFDRAEELLNRALSLEPEFARAHAALSDVWVARGMTLGEIGQFGQRASLGMQRIITAAERAVALDPNSAEAHTSLGSAYTSAWRLADATRTLRHAVALNPNYATGRQNLGRALLAQGIFAEGAAELARAAELDPLSHRIIDNNAIALLAIGRPAAALAAGERALALMPDSVQAAIWRARSLSSLGRHEEAVAQARRVKDDGGPQSAYLVEVFTAADLKSEAEGILAREDRKFPAWRFIGLVALGRHDEALAAMNPADMVPQFFYQANLDPVRDDPRFKQLLATLGLTEANARIQAWRKAHPSEMLEAVK